MNGRNYIDDVWSIPWDKNTGKNNYNVGNMSLAVMINRTCPRKKTIYTQDSCVILNHSMIQNLGDSVKSKFLTVPDYPGICLRPIEVFHSNYFVVPGTTDTEGAKSKDIILQSVVATSVISKVGSNTENYEIIQQYLGWKAIDGIYNNPGSQATEIAGNNNSYFYKGAVFGHKDFTEPSSGSLQAVNSGSSSGESDSSSKYDLSYYEMGNGRIQYIEQKAFSPCDQGLHWGAERVTPLVKGEDFAIRFRWMADVPDNKNVEPKPFDLTDMSVIDAQYEPSSTREQIPINFGLGMYKLETESKEPEKAGDPTITCISGIEADSDTKKALTLNSQAYIILRFNNSNIAEKFMSGEEIFIVISQRAGILAYIKTGKYSYCLGRYQGLDGGKVFIKDGMMTMRVRNHLGTLIVTFDGNDQIPWILQYPTSIWNEDATSEMGSSALTANGGCTSHPLKLPLPKETLKGTLGVAAGSLKMYGGNLSAAFCYSTITYPGRGDLDIPIGGADYSLPYIGVDSIVLALDDSTGLYSCDAIYVKNSKIKIKPNDDIAKYSFDPPEKYCIKSTYGTSGKYFKDIGQTPIPDNPCAANPPMIDENYWLGVDFVSPKILPKEQSISYSGNIIFKSGYIKVPVRLETTVEGKVVYVDRFFDLRGAKTPIVHCLHLSSIPSTELAWKPSGIDVSNNVMNVSLSSQSQDFNSITTSGSIKFLVNWNMPTINMSDGKDQWTVDTNAIARTIEGYADKTFYIEIWGTYFTPGNCTSYTQIGSNSSSENEWFKLFTGLCFGGSLEEKAGERTLNCQLQDYSKILQESLILNGPFLDGVESSIAIKTLLNRLNMPDTFTPGNGTDLDVYGPAYWINMLAGFMAETNGTGENATEKYAWAKFTYPDGRTGIHQRYALPSSYNIFKEPFIKPADGSNYWNEIVNIAKKAGALVFFDQYGCLRFMKNPYDEYLFATTEVTSSMAAKAASEALWIYTRHPYATGSSNSAEGHGQLIFESLTREKSMVDCINTIKMMTGSPYGELNLANKTNYPSLFDPNSPGFIGFLKMYLQNEGIFGSSEALQKAIDHYSKFFYPPTIYKIQSFGLPILCLDLAALDGNPFIITSVSSEFDKSQNKWWQTVEGEWYGPPAVQN